MQLTYEYITLREIVLFFAMTITSSSSFSLPFLQDRGNSAGNQCSNNEYSYSNRCCQKCPAGTHVLKHCSANHRLGHCKNCTTGKEFTAYPNGLNTCLPCRACREDEEPIEQCSLTRDTLCQCKPGTYLCKANMNCSNIGTCSTCLSCPEGQRIKQQCNATTNTVCEHISIDKASSDLKKEALIMSLPIFGVFIIICFASLLFYVRRKGGRGEGTNTPPTDHPVENAPEGDCSDNVFGEQFSDSELSVSSHTLLINEKEDLQNRNADIQNFKHDVLAPKNSMEWLSNFSPNEAAPEVSFPADELLPARKTMA